jgi:hypothetical protein
MGHLNADVANLSNDIGKLLFRVRLTPFQIIVWLEIELRAAKLISTTEDQVSSSRSKNAGSDQISEQPASRNNAKFLAWAWRLRDVEIF